MSEINVTPMVDVMLVLLIIFMVTAPLLTVGVDVDAQADLPKVELPKTEAGPVDAGAGAVERHHRSAGQDLSPEHRDRL